MDISNERPDGSRVYTEKELVTMIVSILESNGRLMLTDLGALLNKLAGPTVSSSIKKEYKGLKFLLGKYKDLFKFVGKIPTIQVELQEMGKQKVALPAVSNKTSSLPAPGISSSSSSSSKPIKIDQESGLKIFKEYLTTLQGHLQQQRWRSASRLLKVRSSLSSQLARFFGENVSKTNSLDPKHIRIIESTIEPSMLVNWPKLVCHHLLACAHYFESSYEPAVRNQLDVLDCFEELWRGVGASTVKPPALDIWRVAVSEARILSTWADISLETAGQESSILVDVQSKLRSYNRLVEKNAGLLVLQNAMVKIYSYCNTTSNYGTVLKVVQAVKIVPKYFPISDVVTWNFYIGRYYLYRGEYVQAYYMLSQAFERCSKNYMKNKQTILTYLLPLRAMMGTYPKLQLLQKYKLEHFHEILQGVRAGNYTVYEQALDKFQAAIERGVYLPLRKLSNVLFRNLIKKTARVIGSMQEPPVDYPKQLQLKSLHTALNLSGYPASMEETECIIINLVATKKIRGYISHQHKVLVLAASEQFPSLAPPPREVADGEDEEMQSEFPEDNQTKKKTRK